MRIVATGGGGQLGLALARLGATVRTRAELDITDAASVDRALDSLRPEVVINAAAYTAVDRAESEPTAAHAVNEHAAHTLARACAARGIGLVHVSSDYVFDGDKPGPYVEDDTVHPINVYGHSKAGGEAAVLRAHPAALVVRSSWVFSADGTNFLLSMLRLARERPGLRVVADQRGCPTHAADLARGLVELAARRVGAGIYHFVGDGPTTWHGLATAIIDEGARAGLCPRVPIEPISTAAFPTPAKRPRASVLSTDCVRALGVVPAPWIDGVRAAVASLRT